MKRTRKQIQADIDKIFQDVGMLPPGDDFDAFWEAVETVHEAGHIEEARQLDKLGFEWEDAGE